MQDYEIILSHRVSCCHTLEVVLHGNRETCAWERKLDLLQDGNLGHDELDKKAFFQAKKKKEKKKKRKFNPKIPEWENEEGLLPRVLPCVLDAMGGAFPRGEDGRD